jgi:signal transduction histidine kinase
MRPPKPFLAYFLLTAIPLLLLAGLNYWNGIRAVNSTVTTIVQDNLHSFNGSVDNVLGRKKATVLKLSIAPDVKRLVTNKSTPDSAAWNSLVDLNGDFQSLTLFDRDRQALWFRSRNTEWNLSDSNSASTRPANLPQPDPRVWELQGNTLLERFDNSTTLECTAPIHDETGAANLGALVSVIDLESVFSNAAQGLETRASREDNQKVMVLVVDREGKLIYNRGSKAQLTNETLPGLESISSALAANQSGVGQFRSASGSSYLAAYSPIPSLNVGVAVARSRSEFMTDAHLWGVAGLVLAVVAALTAAFLIERQVQKRTRGMARVTEDLSAIAKGELDRRILLQSSDDARGLADNINIVTERLREQIAREEESRQFESFVRLSAMLTHELKNAIEGLSLTVSNMERHFDNPQFRADALKGLTSATEKLKALVARLARPLTSLSGEHKRPTNVDLVPILKRVVARTAEPLRSKHTIVMRLPQSLFALVDAARIEEVIENLVLNALEAMVDKGGTLTLEAGETANGAPTFSISDTGRGMSRSFIEHRLFRPFSTTKKTGIGLGLYTCREVITASAGTIEVESVEGAGTTFRVVLPSIPHDRRN